MAQSFRTARRAVAVCLTVALSTSAVAVAAVPKGTLSHAEYKQLTAGMTALNRSVGASSINWSRARAACRSIGRASALLRTQRASCLQNLAVLDSLANFPREQRGCSAKITTPTTTSPTTTTTGTSTTTTTSPADSATIQLLVCMSPRYRALARYARALDRGDIAARRSALARGFSGRCLAALVSTPADLKKAKLFASSTGRLSADVAVLIKVTEGRAPSSDFNQARIDNDVRQFETSASAVLNEHGQPTLSVCPHQ